MFAIELLHTYTPDQERRNAAKVVDNTAEHLTYAERQHVEQICEQMDRQGNYFSVLSMQHVGPIGEALEAAATVASAGYALGQFMLTRALINPDELAAAKTGVAECWLCISDLSAKLIGPNGEVTHDMAQYVLAKEFLVRVEADFLSLFEDLERNAHKRFPHLVPQLEERGNNVQS